jgi:hypothetical protein
VIVVQRTINAHATIVTVLEIFRTADAAKTTVRAMVRTFLIRHPQVADAAMVFTELDEACDAIVAVGNKWQRKK